MPLLVLLLAAAALQALMQTALLALSRAVNVLVPIAFGRAVDALTPQGGAIGVAAVPVAIVVAYGATRLLSSFLSESADAVFSRVQGRGMRRIALEVFEHLHRLSLRFHLDRQTGGTRQRRAGPSPGGLCALRIPFSSTAFRRSP